MKRTTRGERVVLRALHESLKGRNEQLEHEIRTVMEENRKLQNRLVAPIPMTLWCPACKVRHIDEGQYATVPHRTHACQGCGLVWRPALVATVGVRFLPGFKN